MYPPQNKHIRLSVGTWPEGAAITTITQHYLKEMYIFFASIPSSFCFKTSTSVDRFSILQTFVLLYKACSRTSVPWCRKEFIRQDQHRLIFSWPAPGDSVVFVPSWHLLPRSIPQLLWRSLFQFFYHASKKGGFWQDHCVLLASCVHLRFCILVLHATATRVSALYLPQGGMPIAVQAGDLVWEHLILFPDCPENLNKERPAASKGWSFTSTGVHGNVMMSRGYYFQ